MSGGVIVVVLAVLAFATALNLFLVLRIAGVVFPPEEAGPVVPLVGQPAPRFEASRQADGQPIAFDDLVGHPLALVFLSAGCSTCRTKTAELLEILPATQQAGVELWIVAADDVHDMAGLIGDSPLADRALAMDPMVRKALNPCGACCIRAPSTTRTPRDAVGSRRLGARPGQVNRTDTGSLMCIFRQCRQAALILALCPLSEFFARNSPVRLRPNPAGRVSAKVRRLGGV